MSNDDLQSWIMLGILGFLMVLFAFVTIAYLVNDVDVELVCIGGQTLDTLGNHEIFPVTCTEVTP